MVQGGQMDHPKLFLAGSAVAAVNTAYGLRPSELPGKANLLSLLLTWPTSEFPRAHLAAQAAATALAVRRGALHSGAGRAGVALNAASMLGRRTRLPAEPEDRRDGGEQSDQQRPQLVRAHPSTISGSGRRDQVDSAPASFPFFKHGDRSRR